MAYEQNGKVYGYEKNLEDVNDYGKTRLDSYSSSEAYADINDFADNIMFEGNMSANDIKSVEILGNGNYKITVILNEEGRESQTGISHIYYTIEYEITSDCKFVKCVSHTFMQRNITEQDVEFEYETYKGTTTITFEYNTLTEEYINGLLQEAISKEITSND